MLSMRSQKVLHVVLIFVILFFILLPFDSNSVLAASPVKATKISAGQFTSLALKSDGTVVAWGDNSYGKTNVPAGLTGVVAIAAGGHHAVALKSDGTVVAWGDNRSGVTNVPAEAQAGVVAIAAGLQHSVALKSDGTVVAWGDNRYGQSVVPAAAQSGVAAIAAGAFYSMVLKLDGTVVAWGYITVIPAGLTGVVAIAAGGQHAVALKSDGSLAAWGLNNYGQTDIPAGLTGVAAIAAGQHHTLVLKSDGSVVAWGLNDQDQSNVPADLNGVVAIAAGLYHSMALKSDGTVVVWGEKVYHGNGIQKVPGRADLSGLLLREGYSDVSFQPSVTAYTYTIGASVSSVHVNATLADSTNTALYVNNNLQTSGNEVTVNVYGPPMVIPIRVEPFLLTGKTYTITVQRDPTPPNVQFSVYGNVASSKTATTVVTVTDTQSGVDPASLQYAWTQTTDVPNGGWGPFTNGDTLLQASGDGYWYLHIRAKDRAGNVVDQVSDPFVLDNRSRRSGGSDYSYAPAPVLPANTDTEVIIKINENYTSVKAAKESSSDGVSALRITLSADQLTAAFASNPTIIIEINSSEPALKVDLPANTLLDVLSKQPDAVVQIKVAEASYTLPVSVLKNISNEEAVTVGIGKVSDPISTALQAAVQSQGSQQQLDYPIDYSLSANGIPITEFKGIYVVRTLTLHSAVDPNKSTAVWVDTNNNLHFVPSVFSNSGGLTLVTVYSPHDSMYTVVQTDKKFEDLKGHWAQADIELLSNKRIVDGVTSATFVPDTRITRAEFAALLVRSLGLVEQKTEAPYTDVIDSDWFAGAVGAAQKAGLINGYEDGTFKPFAEITREEMASMIARAVKFVGKVPQLGTSTLQQFTDNLNIADWAKEASSQLVTAHIIQGTIETTFSPKEIVTRAQSAVMLKRMLQYLQFIN